MKALGNRFDETVLDFGRQLRLSYLPPLMVYLAAGISRLTAIVGTFFIKDFLGLSAAFLAGLAFCAGVPWAPKMPLGHLIDLIWRRKIPSGLSRRRADRAQHRHHVRPDRAPGDDGLAHGRRGLVRAERTAGAGRIKYLNQFFW